MQKIKIIRITTAPISLKVLLKGQLKFMSSFFEVIGIASSGGEIEDVRVDEGIKVIPLEMTRRITPLKDLIALFKLYKILKLEKPIIVHSHTPKAGLIGMIASKLANVPCRMHTVAGMPLMESKGFKRILLLWVERVTYMCASRVYPNSKGLFDFIIKEKLTKDTKLKIIASGSSNGIDTVFFSPDTVSFGLKEQIKASLDIKATDFVFVFIGRLVSDKGINELVHAFNELKNIETKLLLVGPMEEALDPLDKSTLKLLSENKNILYVGYQKDVRGYLGIANALVFPSYREGFPNVVLQAGAMGVPSIVTNINGCNEIIENGINGIIIPPKNSEALRESMNLMYKDEKLRRTLALNCRNMITKRYDQGVFWRALLDEYEMMTNR